jgi:hypothetical protein
VRALLLCATLSLAACSSDTSDADEVFRQAFGQEAPSDFAVVHGYRWDNRHLGVFYETYWRLHLRGPGAMRFLQTQWPDLQPWQAGWIGERPETPWFAPKHPDSYDDWNSLADPAVTVRRDKESGDIYVSYVAL